MGEKKRVKELEGNSVGGKVGMGESEGERNWERGRESE